MNASLLLGVRILNNVEFGCGAKFRNFSEGDEVVNLLAIEFEVKASVLECRWKVNDRLSDFVDLFLRRNLSLVSMRFIDVGWYKSMTNHDLHLASIGIRQDNGKVY